MSLFCRHKYNDTRIHQTIEPQWHTSHFLLGIHRGDEQLKVFSQSRGHYRSENCLYGLHNRDPGYRDHLYIRPCIHIWFRYVLLYETPHGDIPHLDHTAKQKINIGTIVYYCIILVLDTGYNEIIYLDSVFTFISLHGPCS